ARVVERTRLVGQRERLQPEQPGERKAALAGPVRFGRDRREGAVELLWSARACKRLQRVEAEAPCVRIECGERRAAAHVPNPALSLAQTPCQVPNRGVRNA